MDQEFEETSKAWKKSHVIHQTELAKNGCGIGPDGTLAITQPYETCKPIIEKLHREYLERNFQIEQKHQENYNRLDQTVHDIICGNGCLIFGVVCLASIKLMNRPNHGMQWGKLPRLGTGIGFLGFGLYKLANANVLTS